MLVSYRASIAERDVHKVPEGGHPRDPVGDGSLWVLSGILVAADKGLAALWRYAGEL